MQIIARPQFYLDVAEEVEYLAAKAGAETALRWQKGVRNTIRNLLHHPHLGHLRTDLQPPGVRS